ncbi:hypothetical protein PSPO01_02206 [Paraphaeosphaeria sporulosa]
MRQSPALLRARAPYLIKNTITGFAICTMVIGICTHVHHQRHLSGRVRRCRGPRRAHKAINRPDAAAAECSEHHPERAAGRCSAQAVGLRPSRTSKDCPYWSLQSTVRDICSCKLCIYTSALLALGDITGKYNIILSRI